MNARPDAPQKRALIVEFKRRHPRVTGREIARASDASPGYVSNASKAAGVPNGDPAPRAAPVPDPKPDPYAEARTRLATVYLMNGLPPRLTTRNGIEYLDGEVIMSLTQRMRAVNQERKRAGEPQLEANPEWLV